MRGRKGRREWKERGGPELDERQRAEAERVLMLAEELDHELSRDAHEDCDCASCLPWTY